MAHREVLQSRKFFRRRLIKTAQSIQDLSKRLNLDNSSAPFEKLQSDKVLRRAVRKVIPEWRDINEICSIAEIIEYTK